MPDPAGLWQKITPLQKIFGSAFFALVFAASGLLYPDPFKAAGSWIAASIASVVSFVISLGSWPGIILGGLIALLFKISADRKTRTLSMELSRTIKYEKEARGRWGSFQKLTYGHIDYFPLLGYKKGYQPTGLAITVLRKLCNGVTLVQYEAKDDWETISDSLARRRYDVLATPIFATFERSRKMRFTMPIFYCNIGLFVNIKLATDLNLIDITFEQMLERLSNTNLTFITVAGEISERMHAKHFGTKKVLKKGPATDILTLFDQMANEQREYLAIFSDSFYSRFNENVRAGRVLNVLRTHQLLYPLCFALRVGDYQLANFLNIRLLELSAEGGALALLAEEIRKNPSEYAGVNSDEIFDHFVAEWPYRRNIQVNSNVTA